MTTVQKIMYACWSKTFHRLDDRSCHPTNSIEATRVNWTGLDLLRIINSHDKQLTISIEYNVYKWVH